MSRTIRRALVLLNIIRWVQLACPFSIQTCTSVHRSEFRTSRWLARHIGVCKAEAASSLPEDVRLPVVLVLSYDGSRFDGWQDNTPKASSSTQGVESASAAISTSANSAKGTQQRMPPKKVRTVQAVLEKFLSKLYSAPVELRAASRTDAGVHARGQVCAYLPPETGRNEPHGGDPSRLAWSLNRQLPPDLRVMAAYRASSLDFHPTFHAIGKQYVYSLEEFPENDHSCHNDEHSSISSSSGSSSSSSSGLSDSSRTYSVPSAIDPLRRMTRWQRPPNKRTHKVATARAAAAVAFLSNADSTTVESAKVESQSAFRLQELGWCGSAVTETCAMLSGTHNFKAFRGSARRSPLPHQRDQKVDEEKREEAPPLPSTDDANICTLTEVSVRLLSDSPLVAAASDSYGSDSNSDGNSGSSGLSGSISSSLGVLSVAGTAHEATVMAAMQSGGDGGDSSSTCSNVINAREALGRQLLNSDARAVDITLSGDRFVYRMCRNIVGALVEVADGSRSPASVQFALDYGRWPGEEPLPLQEGVNHGDSLAEDGAGNCGNEALIAESSLEVMQPPSSRSSPPLAETEVEVEAEAVLLAQSRRHKFKKGRPLCAPPQGLTLKRVVYPPGSFDSPFSSEEAEEGEADSNFSSGNNQGTIVDRTADSEKESSTTTTSRSSPNNSRRSVLEGLSKALPVAASTLAMNAPTSTLAAGFGASSSSSPSDSAIVVYGLATAIRARVRVRAVEELLTAALSSTASSSNSASSSATSSSSSSSSSLSSSSSVLSDARAAAKTVVNGKFVSAANAAVNSLRQAKSPSAQAAADHAFAAREYLSMIVEFDALDDLTFESTGRLGRIVTPEKLAFVRKAANSAGRELDLFLATFDPSDVANAREILLDAGEPAR